MDLLLALVVVLVAWFIFKSLFAVVLVAAACALVVYVLRNSDRTL